jgi:hypothetical protein
MAELNSDRVDQVRAFARGLSLAVIAIAGIALLGYILGQPLLFQVRPTLRGMSPLTATALASVAAAVLASSWLRERLMRAAAAFAAILSLAALASHPLVGADNLSPVVGAALFGVPIEQVGRMSVATATSLIFLAAAAIVRRRHPFTADVSSGLGLVIAGTALQATSTASPTSTRCRCLTAWA